MSVRPRKRSQTACAAPQALNPDGTSDEEAELSILLCDDEHIQALSRKWRGMTEEPAVLSFPQDDGGSVLGDLVVSLDAAVREPLGVASELRFLLVHGLLQLLGYNEECAEEAEEMAAAETRLLRRLRWEDRETLGQRRIADLERAAAAHPTDGERLNELAKAYISSRHVLAPGGAAQFSVDDRALACWRRAEQVPFCCVPSHACMHACSPTHAVPKRPRQPRVHQTTKLPPRPPHGAPLPFLPTPLPLALCAGVATSSARGTAAPRHRRKKTAHATVLGFRVYG